MGLRFGVPIILATNSDRLCLAGASAMVRLILGHTQAIKAHSAMVLLLELLGDLSSTPAIGHWLLDLAGWRVLAKRAHLREVSGAHSFVMGEWPDGMEKRTPWL